MSIVYKRAPIFASCDGDFVLSFCICPKNAHLSNLIILIIVREGDGSTCFHCGCQQVSIVME
jgi:hypothetical protein